jgi:hypothetical protein
MKYRFKKLYSGEPIDYRIRVIPTRPLGAGVGVTSAPVLIKSVEQFRSFVDGAHYGWQWDQARLDDLFKKYNASFFETRVLAAGVVSASSGSTRVTVSDVIKTETGVDLPDHLSFCRAADVGIARQICEAVERHRKQQNAAPETCRRKRRLTTGVTGADDNDIGLSGDKGIFFITCFSERQHRYLPIQNRLKIFSINVSETSSPVMVESSVSASFNEMATRSNERPA